MHTDVSQPRTFRRILCGVGATLALAQSAHAEVSGEDRVLGTALFREARAMLQQGRVQEACRKFEESYRVDPAPGTFLNMALCHEAEGKTATAWAELNEAASQAKKEGRRDRLALASEHLAAVEPRLSKLSIDPGPNSTLQGLVISRDGKPIGAAAWHSEIPVDPGHHQVDASAPGYAPWSARVTVGAERDRVKVLVPALLAQPEPASSALPAAPPASATPPSSATPPAPATPPPASSARTQRVIGYSLGGLGAVATLVGGYFAYRAFSKHADANKACEEAMCSWAGVEAENDARTAADISTVSLAVGVASLGAAAVLLLTSPDHRSEPEPGTQQKMVHVGGTAVPGGGFASVRLVF